MTGQMEKCLSDIERKVLAVVQKGFPGSRTPYKDMAQQIGIAPAQLLAVLEDWRQCGRLRRVGAIVNHFKTGVSAGAMVVWMAQPECVEQAGRILAGFKEVSHAYQRQTTKNWPYNLYTMVHGNSDEQLQQTIERMSQACEISDYRILTTEKELKKVPPTYIVDSEANKQEG